jgi:hypothetical protein
VVDAILVDTIEIGVAGAGLTVLATQASVNTIDDFLDTEIAAIKAKTDQLTFTTANRVDSQVFGLENNTLTAASLAADAGTEIATAVGALTLTELTGIPSASPALKDALALLYMAVRNLRTTTATADTISNDAGATIATATLSDNGTTFSKSEYV